MLRIGSQTEYSARIMLRLAGQAEGIPLCAERIAALERIPRDYVDQLLMRLRRAGLIRSLRGVRGGYTLARPMREVSVGNVIRAVEARVFEPVCTRYASRPGRASGEHPLARSLPVHSGRGRASGEHLLARSLPVHSGRGRCPRPEGCGMRPVWEKLGHLVEGYLDGVSLAELAGGRVP